jgi:mono/diheme cytochrome c family protein
MGRLRIANVRAARKRRIAAGLLAISVGVDAFGRSVWDGVYSKEQAARGQTAYREECARCHGENLGGGESAPALAGNDFLGKWNGRSVGDLLDSIVKTMPADDPGNLARRQYADIAAFMLSANDFPAGTKDLENTPATLKDIVFGGKK